MIGDGIHIGRATIATIVRRHCRSAKSVANSGVELKGRRERPTGASTGARLNGLTGPERPKQRKRITTLEDRSGVETIADRLEKLADGFDQEECDESDCDQCVPRRLLREAAAELRALRERNDKWKRLAEVSIDSVREHVGPFMSWPESLKESFVNAIIDHAEPSEDDIHRTQELARQFGWKATGEAS